MERTQFPKGQGPTPSHREPRRKVRLRVVTPRGASMTINVSSGGFCTRLMRVLPVDERIEGTIHVDGRDEPFVGRVAWVRPGNPRMNLMGEMGVRFERSNPSLAREVGGRDP